MPWLAIKARAIGSKHVAGGIPCQDNVAYETLLKDEVVIGAVSDGAGSAPHSHVGSDIAVRVALEYLKSQQWNCREALTKDQAKKLFQNLLRIVLLKLDSQAKSSGFPLHDLACTLLVFAASPQWLVAMQLGDGLIVVRMRSSNNYKLLFLPDKGEYINETSFVTSLDALDRVKICSEAISPLFICAATDGIENISLFKQDDWQPSSKFFRPLETHLYSIKSYLQKQQELDDFLNSDRLNDATDDDKALLLCSYENALNHNFTPAHIELEQQVAETSQVQHEHSDFFPRYSQKASRESQVKIQRKKGNNKPLAAAPVKLFLLTCLLLLVGFITAHKLLDYRANRKQQAQDDLWLQPFQNSTTSQRSITSGLDICNIKNLSTGQYSQIDGGRPVICAGTIEAGGSVEYFLTTRQKQNLTIDLQGTGIKVTLKEGEEILSSSTVINKSQQNINNSVIISLFPNKQYILKLTSLDQNSKQNYRISNFSAL
ncbi:PP2C family serine/threonine-protein phosphatase [Leptolyngbya ohadii]|uniref:PP2C family serine/threonine-protein phosphatase n=1 Tax=Leptolyngbya ohadii TaxID=1962290 RepID=UPI000B59D6D4|nr:PP2C family serine/threonine-protein phosphatase [Leptolyngbya ohadii]